MVRLFPATGIPQGPASGDGPPRAAFAELVLLCTGTVRPAGIQGQRRTAGSQGHRDAAGSRDGPWAVSVVVPSCGPATCGMTPPAAKQCLAERTPANPCDAWLHASDLTKAVPPVISRQRAAGMEAVSGESSGEAGVGEPAVAKPSAAGSYRFPGCGRRAIHTTRMSVRNIHPEIQNTSLVARVNA